MVKGFYLDARGHYLEQHNFIFMLVESSEEDMEKLEEIASKETNKYLIKISGINQYFWSICRKAQLHIIINACKNLVLFLLRRCFLHDGHI